MISMDNFQKVLIDSSVWIDYFRKGKSKVEEQVNLLLDENRIVLCGMVELEILQGLRGNEQVIIQDLFSVLHYVNTERSDFVNAGLILNDLRKKGITIPSSDCLIAAQCLHHKLPLFTLDKDFKQVRNLKFYIK